MTDIVAELRQRYEAAPQGKWTLKPFVDLRGRAIGYDIRTGPRRRDVIEVATSELCDLIVAMHNHLPQLLDVVEAVRELETFRAAPARDDDEWWNERNRLHERRRVALAALEQDGTE